MNITKPCSLNTRKVSAMHNNWVTKTYPNLMK
jgi:hypothetical protein